MSTETMTITTTSTTPLLLTSGASGRVNALLSLRALKSLALIIKAFIFFLLFFPFQLGRTSTRSSSSSSTSSPTSSSPNKDDNNNKKKRKLQDISAPQRFTPNKNPFLFRRLPTPTPSPSPSSSSSSSSMAMVTVPNQKQTGDLDVASRRSLAVRRATLGADHLHQNTIKDVSLFLTSRGDTLFTQSWTPTAPAPTNIRGVVVLLHGLNEHSGRYDAFARKLNLNGYKVYGMDWIGHGGSDGLHGYVHSLDYAVDDMKAFLEKVVTENPGLPCFCFGHSTGAAIILKAILDPRIKVLVKGVVLTSPAVRVQPSHPIFKVLAPIFSFLLPRYQFRAANKNGTCVSRDAEALMAKYTDPLVYTGSIRVRTGYEILRISSYLQQHLSRLTTPFLVLHGASDAVTDPEASQELHEKASAADKAIKLYQGLLHDILFEPEKEIVANDIIAWLNSRV